MDALGGSKSTMHCPHGMVRCATCEISAAAKELQALRTVAERAHALMNVMEAGAYERPNSAWTALSDALVDAGRAALRVSDADEKKHEAP